ncbi:MAG: polynucleotide kinase-phosphatase, partial [Chloroflexota bacterium]|nr:polynucleotide kinase-phosphatase [Chloroflexota bacterium]
AALGASLLATAHRVVDVTEPESQAEGIRWWEELTACGGEGMVVKPLQFVARGRRGLVQPAVKCRGAEYLRIIYGPEYTRPENLERFVRQEPLRRVHECAFGVLALESEPLDPRL